MASESETKYFTFGDIPFFIVLTIVSARSHVYFKTTWITYETVKQLYSKIHQLLFDEQLKPI